ncbi:MAG: SusC/RagA family TonB-linked outer membrane protein [Bacteroidales bacterium]|jgi:TonB-linked SusC/RagA family outer membrane protein
MKNKLMLKQNVMRTSLVVFLSILFTGIMMAHDTKGQKLNKVRVSLNFEEVRVKKALEILNEETEFNFIYNEKDIRSLRKVTVTASSENLKDFLVEISKQTGLSFQMINKNIAVQLEKKEYQEQRIITGQVTEASTGEPLIGASVQLNGTLRGVITDANGNYRIEVPEDTEYLIVSYVGYVPIEIKINDQDVINISLQTDKIDVDEVVVTALGISREEKKIPHAYQKVSGDVVNEGSNKDVLSALSGKFAGVNIRNTTGIGGTTRIVIRGETSLSSENQPLIVIDGVPIDNSIRGSHGQKVDYGTQINDISPDNIESINVLKGPSASALYGSRASSGAVIITTKRAKMNSGFNVEYTTDVTFNSVLRLPEYQNKYGGGKGPDYEFSTGDGTVTNDGHGVNWGDRLDAGIEKIQFTSPVDPETGERIPTPWVSYPDNVKNFFETGNIFSNSLAFSGGGERTAYRVSISHMDQKGVVPNTDLHRTNISTVIDAKLGKRAKISTNFNYAKSGSDNIPPHGYSRSLMYNFIWFYRNVPIDAVRDYWLPGQENIAQRNFETKWVNNVYFIVYENRNSFDKNRGYGNIRLDYRILPGLNLMVRTAFDMYSDRQQTRKAKGDRYDPEGNYNLSNISFLEQNHDFLFRYSKSLNTLIDMELSFGGNTRIHTTGLHMSEISELNDAQIYSLNNVKGDMQSEEYNTEKKVNSLYGFAGFSFDESIFLEFTLRNDWSSTLPADNNSYLYPSVGLSALFNEIFNLPDFLSFAKLGIAWASVGNDTDPYNLYPVMGKADNWEGLPLLYEPNTVYNTNLKPERVDSKEVNATIRFFQNRLGINASYYITDSRDQILSIKLPVSTGYENKYINAGHLQSKGLELSVNGQIISNGVFGWNIVANWSRSRTKILELTEGVDNYVIYSDWGLSVEAREGEYFGDMYGKSFARTEDGRLIHDSNGLPEIDNEIVKHGNYNPDWTLGIWNGFRVKNFNLNFLFDYQHGGDIYSLTIARGRHAGSLVGTGEDNGVRDNGIISEGVVDNGDGTYSENTVRATAYNYYRRINSADVLEAAIYDATYLKLREATLSYTLPSKFLSGIPVKAGTISIYGSNLFLWSKVDHIDPDDFMQYNGMFLNGYEALQMPSTRNYGVRLNIVF